MCTINASDIIGHNVAKRALEIAIVGNHTIMLYGPRGVGKSTLASAYRVIASQITECDSCLCGNYQSVIKDCTCNPQVLYRWLRRVSRIAELCDIVIEVSERTTRELLAKPVHTDYAKQAIARIRSAKAFGVLNTSILLGDPASACYRTLEMATRRIALNYRSIEKIIRVARTIANLDHVSDIQAKHIAEAVQYQYFAYVGTTPKTKL